MTLPVIVMPVAVLNTLTHMPARSVLAIYSLLREKAPTLSEVNQLREMAMQGVVDDRTWALIDQAWHETLVQQRRILSALDRQELVRFRARLDSIIGQGSE